MQGVIFNLTVEKCRPLLTAVRSSSLKFKFDPKDKDLFGYVYSESKSFEVFLGPMFFEGNDEKPLSKDCKIGTLIHELSHFKDVLGTEDLGVDHYKDLLWMNSESFDCPE